VQSGITYGRVRRTPSCAHDFVRFQQAQKSFLGADILAGPGTPGAGGAGSRNFPPRWLAAPEALRMTGKEPSRLNAADLWITGSVHPSLWLPGHRPAPPGRGSAMDRCRERTGPLRNARPNQRENALVPVVVVTSAAAGPNRPSSPHRVSRRSHRYSCCCR